MTTPLYLPGAAVPELDGVSAGVMRSDDGTHFCLVIPNDPRADFDPLEWGSYGKEIPGADSTWDGLANTRAMLDTDLRLPAAEALAVLNFDDNPHPFYLPSQRELALCWATVPHLFQRTWYWSSTQYSAHYAWYQGFTYGYQDIGNKLDTGRVRAVRRLVIQ